MIKKNQLADSQNNKSCLLNRFVGFISFLILLYAYREVGHLKTAQYALDEVSIKDNKAVANQKVKAREIKNVLAQEKPATFSVEGDMEAELSPDYKTNIRSDEYFNNLISELYRSHDLLNENERDVVQFVLTQNAILFDHVIGPENRNRNLYLTAAKEMLERKEILTKNFLENRISQKEFATQLRDLADRFQADCRPIFDEEEFQKMFQIGKTESFSDHLGI